MKHPWKCPVCNYTAHSFAAQSKHIVQTRHTDDDYGSKGGKAKNEAGGLPQIGSIADSGDDLLTNDPVGGIETRKE